jgi:hypothetical protein
MAYRNVTFSLICGAICYRRFAVVAAINCSPRLFWALNAIRQIVINLARCRSADRPTGFQEVHARMAS